MTIFEGWFVAIQAIPDPHFYFTWLGFLPGRHTPKTFGYPAALLVAALFIAISADRLPSVRVNLSTLFAKKIFLQSFVVCSATYAMK